MLLNSSLLKSGFTLVELVVILSIIGILSINVAPKFYNRQVYNEALFLQDALASLKFAQKLALNTGCHVQANLNSVELSLNYRDDCTSGNFTTAVKNPGLNQATFIKKVPSGLSIVTDTMPLYFDGAGSIHAVNTDVIQDFIIKINGLSLKLLGQSGLMYAA